MRECKDFCRRLDRVSFGFGGKIYANGVKYCKTCSRYLKINGYRCTCCSSILRSKSHTKRWKTQQIRGSMN